jgi:hypothetical protein
MTAFYIMLPLGLLLVVVALGVGAYEHTAIRRGTIVEGRVVGNVRRSSSKGRAGYTPEITFTTKQGRDVLFSPSFSSNPPMYGQGDKVRVVYQGDGEDPRILSFGTRFGLAWSLMCAGVALVVIALGFGFGNDFVNSYYASSTFLFGR